jgi:hypothetical protein
MFRYLSLVAAVVSALACSSSGKSPQLPSSSSQSSYALQYDEELNSTTKAIGDLQTRSKTLTSSFATTAEPIKKTDWAKVETVIDDSDAAGKSSDFASAENDATVIRNFWDSEKNEIAGRVNGAAAAKLKEQGCSGDTGGAIGYAVGDALQKQLQKKLRSKNEAFLVIDRYKVALGPQNVPILEKLADDISEASYDVHVQMILQKNRLERLVADKNDVKKTLDRFIKEETDYQNEAGRTDAEKKASAERINTANKSKAEIDSVGTGAETQLKDLDKAIDAATKDYDEALKGLRAKIADKKKVS